MQTPLVKQHTLRRRQLNTLLFKARQRTYSVKLDINHEWKNVKIRRYSSPTWYARTEKWSLLCSQGTWTSIFAPAKPIMCCERFAETSFLNILNRSTRLNILFLSQPFNLVQFLSTVRLGWILFLNIFQPSDWIKPSNLPALFNLFSLIILLCLNSCIIHSLPLSRHDIICSLLPYLLVDWIHSLVLYLGGPHEGRKATYGMQNLNGSLFLCNRFNPLPGLNQFSMRKAQV